MLGHSTRNRGGLQRFDVEGGMLLAIIADDIEEVCMSFCIPHAARGCTCSLSSFLAESRTSLQQRVDCSLPL
jgi:hypothetical protein